MSASNYENIDLKGHQQSIEHPVNQISAASLGVSLTKKQAGIVKDNVTFMHLFARDRRKVKKSGISLMCCCPFHQDSTPSFSVYNEGKSARCFGCGWKGDIFDYEQQAHHVSFREALDRLEKVALRPPKYPGEWLSPKSESKPSYYIPSTEEIQLQVEASTRLAEDHALCESIAKARGWRVDTIQGLADEGSLGWHEGALVLNYNTGMKLRAWPDRKFWWKFGVSCVWRSDQIRDEGQIFLCEGETDAMSLIDIGLEQDGECSIVALPSATSIPFGLATMFEGRDVVLCMDNDEAGERAVDRLVPLLLPSCSSVSTFVYKEVQP